MRRILPRLAGSHQRPRSRPAMIGSRTRPIVRNEVAPPPGRAGDILTPPPPPHKRTAGRSASPRPASYLRTFVPSYLRTFVPSYLRTFVPSSSAAADLQHGQKSFLRNLHRPHLLHPLL